MPRGEWKVNEELLDFCCGTLFRACGRHTNESASSSGPFSSSNHLLLCFTESPKKLQSLCVLAVRRAVGDCKGWSAISSTLEEIKFDNAPLPQIIMERLHFKQVSFPRFLKFI